jgi:hypothetical protein
MAARAEWTMAITPAQVLAAKFHPDGGYESIDEILILLSNSNAYLPGRRGSSKLNFFFRPLFFRFSNSPFLRLQASLSGRK